MVKRGQSSIIVKMRLCKLNFDLFLHCLLSSTIASLGLSRLSFYRIVAIRQLNAYRNDHA